MSESKISQMLREHYTKTFELYGESPKGVDWGEDNSDHLLRLEKILSVTELGETSAARKSILDVGCGYGRLYDLAISHGEDFEYHGVDLCKDMISTARKKHKGADWIVGDILDFDEKQKYDYVVCNGILTQRLHASIREMDLYAKKLIKKMYDLCRIGIAFNVMTTHVNYMADNLYYRNPVEFMAWSMTELSPRVRLDHAYPLFEYTVHVYREDAKGIEYGAHRAAEI